MWREEGVGVSDTLGLESGIPSRRPACMWHGFWGVTSRKFVHSPSIALK